MKYTIGIDMGESFIKAAIVDKNLNIVHTEQCEVKIQNQNDGLEIENDLCDLIDTTLKNGNVDMKNIENIGIASPGIVNIDTKIAEYACNFDYKHKDFADIIQKRLEKPVYIENDANAAALGEYYAYKDTDIKNMVYIILKIGLGGGIILNGELYRGFNFGASEPGHMVICKGGRQCNCTRKGCFEMYAAGRGLTYTAKENLIPFEGKTLLKLDKNGDIKAQDIFSAAKRKDELALKILDIFVEDLAEGITNMVNIFQPQVLVIGGSFCYELETLLPKIRELVLKYDHARSLSARSDIKISDLKDDAGVLGAAILYKYIQN